MGRKGAWSGGAEAGEQQPGQHSGAEHAQTPPHTEFPAPGFCIAPKDTVPADLASGFNSTAVPSG